MFPNLEAELARKKITRASLAKTMNMSVNTIGRKLNGDASLSLEECIKIKKILGVNLQLEELFQTEANNYHI